MTPVDEQTIRANEEINERLRDGNARMHAFLNSLQDLITALDARHDDEQVMSLLSASLDALLNGVNASLGSLLVTDEEHGELVYILVNGPESREEMKWQRISSAKGVSGWVLRHGEAAIVNEAPADERFNTSTDIPEGITAETLMCVPVVGQDKTLGVITLINKRVDVMFTDDDQTLAWLMGRFAGELLHRMGE